MHNLIRYVMLAKIDSYKVAKCVHITGTHGIGLKFSNKTSTISYRYTATNNMKEGVGVV